MSRRESIAKQDLSAFYDPAYAVTYSQSTPELVTSRSNAPLSVGVWENGGPRNWSNFELNECGYGQI